VVHFLLELDAVAGASSRLEQLERSPPSMFFSVSRTRDYRLCQAAWAQLEARDPFRDRDRDGICQAVLRKQIIDNAGTSRIEFDTLYEKVLGDMSYGVAEGRSRLSFKAFSGRGVPCGWVQPECAIGLFADSGGDCGLDGTLFDYLCSAIGCLWLKEPVVYDEASFHVTSLPPGSLNTPWAEIKRRGAE
jgi:hypothetical protein